MGLHPMAALACLLLPTADAYETARNTMVDRYLVAEGIDDERVVAAMRATPRHEFVRAPLRRFAYDDRALDIGLKQTISPPYIVAYMTQTLEVQPHHRVLEIGTGSGYQAAVLSPLAREVYSIEIVPQLGRSAAAVLKRLGYENVFTRIGDGYAGWPEQAPFDRIIVTCSPEDVPTPLVEQLAEGGRLLIPLGERYQQVFHLFEKRDGKLVQTRLVPTLFVPMTGRSEELRDVQPDGSNPQLRNGSFEELLTGSPTSDPNRDDTTEPDVRPAGWHYQRNLTVLEDAAEGRHAIRLQRDDADELAQCVQGLPLDGRRVRELDISLAARGQNIVVRGDDRPPALTITFYDARRLVIARAVVGPFRNPAADWSRISRTVAVPRGCREAIVALSMNDATGTLDLDAVVLTPAASAR